LLEAVDHHDVASISEALANLVERDPADFVHLVLALGSGAKLPGPLVRARDHGHGPIADGLEATVFYRIGGAG
jgi:hypothetical protein